MTNPLKRLGELGQSPWIDYLRRSFVESGELEKLVERDGLGGVTSNPSIFDKAIRGSRDYDSELEELRRRDLGAQAIYESLAVRDIQGAADVLKPVYDATGGGDGFVSLEVSPRLADDTAQTIAEARRLWSAVDRPNLMVKVPATGAGIEAVEQLVFQGINVNVTLLFARPVYERVIEAYLTGLERRAAEGGGLANVASVASFFVSRIDAAVEARLRAVPEMTRSALAGRVAIANAKLAYQIFLHRFAGERWARLEASGARKQRLLWASTGVKNPSYPDTLYVDSLIGADTVSTMPKATLDAYREHGSPRARLESGLDDAAKTLSDLERAGIRLDEVTDELTRDGVRSFVRSFDDLLEAVDDRSAGKEPGGGDRSRFVLEGELAGEFDAVTKEWGESGKMRRLWERDASLWTGADEAKWLGWLSLADAPEEREATYREVSSWVRESELEHAVVLGMGGSSLCPEVLSQTFAPVVGFPKLHVLDSTDPAQVRALDERLDIERTLFIVSSKSGTTLEPNIFMDYFYDRVRRALGERAGERFFAVTDPGSKLETEAKELGFARVFHGIPSVGGRYSALSSFGMVPAAVMGLDVRRLLGRAEVMAEATSSCVPVDSNPGARLGIAMGVAARQGRDKLTLVASPRIRDLGAWLEQLIAESTGKHGKGIVPVDREAVGAPSVYGDDRLFVYLRLERAPDATQDTAIQALERSGQPVVTIPVESVEDLGQEFFRWEIATAVAGSVLGIHPFDQPDVEASKLATRKLTEEYERRGELPSETPLFEDGAMRLYADSKNAESLGRHDSLTGYLRAHLDRLEPGDYFALLAYIEMNETHENALATMRHAVRDEKRVATCLGFGPRFLHSTGQAYKGGPPSGVFLQITCDPARDLEIPGRGFTFGIVEAAQARGDFEVLAERGRRALRVHLGTDVPGGLLRLGEAVSEALAP